MKAQNNQPRNHEVTLAIPLGPDIDPLIETAGKALADIFGRAEGDLGMMLFQGEDESSVTPAMLIHCEAAVLTELKLSQAFMVALYVQDHLKEGAVSLIIDDDVILF